MCIVALGDGWGNVMSSLLLVADDEDSMEIHATGSLPSSFPVPVLSPITTASAVPFVMEGSLSLSRDPTSGVECAMGGSLPFAGDPS